MIMRCWHTGVWWGQSCFAGSHTHYRTPATVDVATVVVVVVVIVVVAAAATGSPTLECLKREKNLHKEEARRLVNLTP